MSRSTEPGIFRHPSAGVALYSQRHLHVSTEPALSALSKLGGGRAKHTLCSPCESGQFSHLVISPSVSLEHSIFLIGGSSISSRSHERCLGGRGLGSIPVMLALVLPLQSRTYLGLLALSAHVTARLEAEHHRADDAGLGSVVICSIASLAYQLQPTDQRYHSHPQGGHERVRH